jgi:predicted amidophosphoribosyltransferase
VGPVAYFCLEDITVSCREEMRDSKMLCVVCEKNRTAPDNLLLCDDCKSNLKERLDELAEKEEGE